MFGNQGTSLINNATKAPAVKPVFAPRAKGAVLNSTPVVDAGLKALAFNTRKKIKIG